MLNFCKLWPTLVIFQIVVTKPDSFKKSQAASNAAQCALPAAASTCQEIPDASLQDSPFEEVSEACDSDQDVLESSQLISGDFDLQGVAGDINGPQVAVATVGENEVSFEIFENEGTYSTERGTQEETKVIDETIDGGEEASSFFVH